VHVRPDDVHLVGMPGANLGAVHFLALAGRRRLGIQRAELRVGLAQRVGVDAGRRAQAADFPAAGSARRVAWSPWLGLRGRELIRDPRHVAAAVAPQLLLDPIDGSAIARRALATVAELREALDRRLVA